MPWVSRSLLFFTVTTFNPIDSQFTKFPAVNNEFSIKTKFRPTSFRFHEGFQSQSSSRFSTNIQNKPTTRLNLFGTRFNDVRNSQAEEDGSPSGSGVPIPVITTTTEKSNLEDKLSSSFSVFRFSFADSEDEDSEISEMTSESTTKSTTTTSSLDEDGEEEEMSMFSLFQNLFMSDVSSTTLIPETISTSTPILGPQGEEELESKLPLFKTTSAEGGGDKANTVFKTSTSSLVSKTSGEDPPPSSTDISVSVEASTVTTTTESLKSEASTLVIDSDVPSSHIFKSNSDPGSVGELKEDSLLFTRQHSFVHIQMSQHMKIGSNVQRARPFASEIFSTKDRKSVLSSSKKLQAVEKKTTKAIGNVNKFNDDTEDSELVMKKLPDAQVSFTSDDEDLILDDEDVSKVLNDSISTNSPLSVNNDVQELFMEVFVDEAKDSNNDIEVEESMPEAVTDMSMNLERVSIVNESSDNLRENSKEDNDIPDVLDSTTTVSVSSGTNAESSRRNAITTPSPSHGPAGPVAPQDNRETELMLELDHMMDDLLHDMEDDANEGLLATTPATLPEKDFPDNHER